MRACAAAVSPPALHANAGAPFYVWSDSNASLTGYVQQPSVEFWHVLIHAEGSEGAGRGWRNAEGASYCLHPNPQLKRHSMLCNLWYAHCVSLLGAVITAGLEGDPIAMSLPSLLFTDPSRDFFTSRAVLGHSQGCKAKCSPMLSFKPQPGITNTAQSHFVSIRLSWF